jgi:F0F1-type ATP synthase epsilon subunit
MLNVTVHDREGIKFAGEARSVSSINSVGNFDILPEHANFICLIKKRLTIVASDNKKTEFNVDSGVIQVLKNQVNVYLGLQM